MDYTKSASELEKARKEMEWWNEEHTFCVPWEWVEEMLLAKRRWHSLARQRSSHAITHYSRYQEFRKKLPVAFVERIENAG